MIGWETSEQLRHRQRQYPTSSGLPPENALESCWNFPRHFLAGSGAEVIKASQFTDAQKAFIIKQGEDGTTVAEICRKAEISQATYFNWKKKYSGMMPSEMKRLRELEQENARLKKIVADLTLDKEMLQDVIRRKL